MTSLRTLRTAAGLAAAALAALAVTQVASAESPVVRFNAADQAAARAAVLNTSDFGAGWSGGRKRAKLNTESPCANWKPKQADLVVTGAAESEFEHRGGVTISSRVYVMQTPRMVQLDWQRTVVHPAAVRCMRSVFANSDNTMRFVSFRRTPFPRVAPYAVRFRAVYAATSSGVRVLMDVIMLARGRTAAALFVVTPHEDLSELDAAEGRLARIVAARARA